MKLFEVKVYSKQVRNPNANDPKIQRMMAKLIRDTFALYSDPELLKDVAEHHNKIRLQDFVNMVMDQIDEERHGEEMMFITQAQLAKFINSNPTFVKKLQKLSDKVVALNKEK